mmetsp:Transcript_55791/g.160311  ORF Transcript_55791/g.160311 Transcript_55791/m.160311 type:complete len:412 (-) Transcript_55791:44-1279(-)
MFDPSDELFSLKLVCTLILAVSISAWLARVLFSSLWEGDKGQRDELVEPGGGRTQSCATLPQTGVVDPVAEEYWSKGYGRYKYCGLRAEPLSSEPPLPCRSPWKLPLPALTDEERHALSALADRVTDLRDAGSRTDQSTLARYLRARKGNVVKAELLLREAVKWRQTHDIDRVFTHWNLAAYEQCLGPWWLSGGLFGHGKRGQAVAYERLGRCNFAKLASSMPFEELLKCDIVHCERCVAALEEDAIRCGHPLIGVTIVMDMEGFGWDQVQYNAAKTISKLAASRSLLLTEITGQILVVRAPPAVARAWGLFKHLLDPGVVAKVEVVTTADTPTRLRVHIDDDAIPVYLGGSKCIDGDPECRYVLAPGGLPSPSVIARFSALAREKVGERAPPGGDPVPARQSAMSCCWGR